MNAVASPEHQPSTRRIRRVRGRSHSALDVVAIGVVFYVLAALLNANHLQRRATQQPYGSSRDTAVALTDGLRWVSHGLGLTAPGHWLDQARGTGTSRGPGLAALAPLAKAPLAAPSPVVTSPAPSSAPTTAAGVVVRRVPLVPTGRRPGLPDGERLGTVTTEARTVTETTAVPTTTAPVVTTTAVPRLTLRNPTPDDPLRVYVGGDSLSQGVGTSLSRVASAFGTMKVLEHGVISSGLTRPDYYDWPAELSRALASGQPEAYVLMFGANDPQTIETPEGNVNIGDPRWEAAYRARVSVVMAALSASRPLIWIGLPAVGRTDLEPQMQLLTRIYAEQAAKYPNVRYIDVRAITGADYTPYLEDGNGKQVLVRAQDKVHFTPAGYDLLAKAAADQLTALIKK